MKIIRLSTFLDYGGIETKMVNLSKENYTKHSWIFCAIGKGGVASRKISDNCREVVCFNKPHKIPSLKAIYSLYRFFKKEKPTVVHCSGAEANFHGVIAARFARVPRIIAEEIGISSQGYLAKKIFYWIYLLAHAVVGESQLVVNSLSQNYGIGKKKLFIVPNFIFFPNINSRTYEASQKKPLSLVSISRLTPVKNIEGVLEVIKLLKDDAIPVLYKIAGSGEQLEFLKQKTEELGITDCVTFLGYINNPYPVLATSDIFVLNSNSEGFSNALLEAMYAGIPSISTSVGAASQIIEEGKNGWLVPIGNSIALYHKIKLIYSLDPLKLKEIGENATLTVTSNYSLKNHLENLMKIYEIN